MNRSKSKEDLHRVKKIKFEIEYPLIKTDITQLFRIMSELEVNKDNNKEKKKETKIIILHYKVSHMKM